MGCCRAPFPTCRRQSTRLQARTHRYDSCVLQWVWAPGRILCAGVLQLKKPRGHLQTLGSGLLPQCRKPLQAPPQRGHLRQLCALCCSPNALPSALPWPAQLHWVEAHCQQAIVELVSDCIAPEPERQPSAVKLNFVLRSLLS